MNNDPVNFVDLWGLTASDRKLTRKEKKELIKKSINNISEFEWAQTEEGKIVVNKLKKKESKGKIKIKEAGEGCNGWYDNGKIVVDDDLSKQSKIESILVHEGTHAVQDDRGDLDIYDFPDEREAYDNGNKYLQSTYNESDERSDEWIRNAYRDDFDK